MVTDLVTDFVTVFVISVVKYKDMEIRPVWWFPAVILGLIVAVGSTEAARYEKNSIVSISLTWSLESHLIFPHKAHIFLEV